MKLRKLSLLLALVMCISLFSACGEKKNASSSDIEEEIEETEKPEETVNPDDLVEEQEKVEQLDYAPAFESVDRNEVMLTVDGIDVTWEQLFYWYFYDIMSLQNYGIVVSDWNEASPFGEDLSYAEFLAENAKSMMTSYCALESNAKAQNIILNDEDKEVINKSWDDSVASYAGGDEEKMISMLEDGFMSKDLFLKLNELSYLLTKVQSELYGENGEKIADDEAIALATEAGYYRSCHILVATTDETGAALDEDAKKEALAKAEGLKKELDALASDSTKLMAKFQELSAANNDDPGAAYSPNGYLATAGQMVPEYEAGALALDDYAISEIVESSFGYHIIIRLPLNYATEGEAIDLKQACISIALNKLTMEWTENANVETTKAYDELDLAEIFGKATIKGN